MKFLDYSAVAVTIPQTDFDPDFDQPPWVWAAMYRKCGLQVLPSYLPGEIKGTFKRPLPAWADLQDALAPELTFERWYGTNGDHRQRSNMGILTGRCSGNVFVIDLDTHSHPEAGEWWLGLLAVHNNRLPIETPTQKTGGGGFQMLFRAPMEWRAPTNKTTIGVDIRGQGGFAVMPPSHHEKKTEYAWLPGLEPWWKSVADAPQWLLQAVVEVVRKYGGGSGTGMMPVERREVTGTVTNEWGRLVDMREDKMFRMVFAVVTRWRREDGRPIKPPLPEQRAKSDEEYKIYEDIVEPTISVPGKTKTELLEIEDRGPTEWWTKFQRCMDQWNDKIREEAAKPSPRQEPLPEVDPRTGEKLSIFLSSKQFVAGFVAPDYLIDGIIQTGFVYSLTARTNHGKTAVSMYIAMCIALGEAMHGREVKGGTVLFFAGENPDDIRMRFLVLAYVYGFDPDKIKIRFKPGIMNIHERFQEISAEADTIDDLVLIVVDTAAAYFTGDDTNNNNQQGVFARQLRRLTTLRGKPTVIINCHPVKNAARDNLLPMGGSAFVNEVDGNLTLWANGEKQTSLHWLGKFRGPEFDPVSFELVTASSDLVMDTKGRLIPSVVAKAISEITLEAGEVVQEQEENRLLTAMHREPRASFITLASRCGFVLDGRPLKSKVGRLIMRLVDDKMLSKHRGGKYRLTQKGRREIGVEDEENDD